MPLARRSGCIIWAIFEPRREIPTEMAIPGAIRRVFLGVLLLVSFWAPAAWPKDTKAEKEPIFMAPGLDFSQIDTICIAPTIDLRLDKTQPLLLSGPSPHVSSWSGKVPPISADDAIAGALKFFGYKTASCSLVIATLDDLKAPSDGWLRKLDFGDSQWLFVLAVEYVKTPYREHSNLWSRNGQAMGKSHAVVSGYLFEKQPVGCRLVWRDKIIGVDYGGREAKYVDANEAGMELTQSEQAIKIGVDSILSGFDKRKKRVWYFHDNTETEIFDVTCHAVWAALKDTFKNPGMYEIIQSDDADMTLVYAHIVADQHEVYAAAQNRMEYAALRPRGNECSMQITGAGIASLGNSGNRGDARWLTERVRAALSK